MDRLNLLKLYLGTYKLFIERNSELEVNVINTQNKQPVVCTYVLSAITLTFNYEKERETLLIVGNTIGW